MDTLTVEEQVTQVATPVDQPSKTGGNRWLWIALAGVLCLVATALLLVLDSEDPAPPASSPAEVAADAADFAFEQYMTDEGFTRYGDVETLKETAQGVCGAFDQGHPWAKVLGVALDSGFSGYDAGAFIAASVVAYCPTHEDALP